MMCRSKGKCATRSKLVCGFILSVLIGSRVLAATVYFGDMDRAPAQQLQIADVTVTTGWRTDFGLPSTVADLGLGAAGIDSNGMVERTNVGTALGSESLLLSVSGTINSVTIVPHFADLANPNQEFVPFEMGYDASGPIPDLMGHKMLYNSDPVTITFGSDRSYSQLELDVSADFGEYIHFADYLQQYPDAQLLFGYTVQSLDYTPVPEPPCLKLALLGLAAILLCQARKENIRNSNSPIQTENSVSVIRVL